MKGFTLSLEQQTRLRGELRQPTSAHIYRRAAALLALHEGRVASEVAALLGVTRQTIYNWLSYRGEGQPHLNLADAPRAGRPSVWTAELDALLEETLRKSPSAFGYVVPQWSAALLRRHLSVSQGPQVSEETVRRRLRRLGYDWTEGRYTRRFGPKSNPTAPASGESAAPILFREGNAVAA